MHNSLYMKVGGSWLMHLTDPVVSAGLGVAWSVSRIVYTLGYCREDYENGRGRSLGAGSSTLILFALIGLGGATGYQMIMS